MILRSRVVDQLLIVIAFIFGAGSILLLIFAGGSGYIRFGWTETEILLWDALLSLLFFVQHSGMVRKAFRTRLTAHFAGEYHGVIYTIGSGIALSIVAIFWQHSEIMLVRLEGVARFIAIGCSLVAVLVFSLSIYALRSFDPLGVGPIRARLRSMDHQPGPFVVRGPYRWVRHPLYACVIVLFWANPVVTADRLLFDLLWTIWIVIGAHLEERDLIREFGQTYVDYQRSVPMLFPWHK